MSLPVIQFGCDGDGQVLICMPVELWNALREVALSEEKLEESEGFVRVPLRQISDAKIRSISLIASSEQPPCQLDAKR